MDEDSQEVNQNSKITTQHNCKLTPPKIYKRISNHNRKLYRKNPKVYIEQLTFVYKERISEHKMSYHSDITPKMVLITAVSKKESQMDSVMAK